MVLGVIEGQTRGGYFLDYILDPSVIDCNGQYAGLEVYHFEHFDKNPCDSTPRLPL